MSSAPAFRSLCVSDWVSVVFVFVWVTHFSIPNRTNLSMMREKRSPGHLSQDEGTRIILLYPSLERFRVHQSCSEASLACKIHLLNLNGALMNVMHLGTCKSCTCVRRRDDEAVEELA